MWLVNRQGGLGDGAVSRTERSTRGATGRSACCLLRRAENGFNRNKSETDSEGESQTFDDGARTHEENKTFLAMPEWNSFARTSSRALASKLCEIFATLGIFLNRTAIQH